MNPSATVSLDQSSQATANGGFLLSPEDCRDLEKGFGLPVAQILKDMVEQARFDAARGR